MGSICGLVTTEASSIEPTVRRMMSRSVHRGSCRRGYHEWHGNRGGAGFGTQRWEVGDQDSPDSQLYVDSRTGDFAVLDGEFTNSRSLTLTLRSHDVHCECGSDAELLVRAIGRWGDGALSRFEGAFAFAFFQRATQRALIARDFFGQKPLFVAQCAGLTAFASTVNALLAVPGVRNDLSPAGLACYLAYGAVVDPLTLHRDILSLSAGEYMWVHVPGAPAPMTSSGYFQPVLFRQLDAQSSQATAIAGRVVRDHLQSAGSPVGVQLVPDEYGMGLAALARASGHCTTIAVAYDDHKGRAQLEHLQAFSSAIDCGQSRVVIDDESIVSHWREVHRTADQPSANQLVLSICACVAAECGIMRVLTAVGYERLLQIAALRPVLNRAALLGRVARHTPRRVRELIARAISGHGGDPLQPSVSNAIAGKSWSACLSRSSRVFDDAALRSLGLDAMEFGITPDYLPFEVDVGPLEADLTPLACLGGRSRDPFIAMVIRDTESIGSGCGIEFGLPWLKATLTGGIKAFDMGCRHALDTHAGQWRAGVADRGSASLQAAARSRPSICGPRILPLEKLFVGPLSIDCVSAIDELASCQYLETSAVRKLWTDFLKGHLDIESAAALVALGLYIERIRSEAF